MTYTRSNTLPFHFGGSGLTPRAAANCGISSWFQQMRTVFPAYAGSARIRFARAA
jgi:hypothetical protein